MRFVIIPPRHRHLSFPERPALERSDHTSGWNRMWQSCKYLFMTCVSHPEHFLRTSLVMRICIYECANIFSSQEMLKIRQFLSFGYAERVKHILSHLNHSIVFLRSKFWQYAKCSIKAFKWKMMLYNSNFSVLALLDLDFMTVFLRFLWLLLMLGWVWPLAKSLFTFYELERSLGSPGWANSMATQSRQKKG